MRKERGKCEQVEQELLAAKRVVEEQQEQIHQLKKEIENNKGIGPAVIQARIKYRQTVEFI